MLLALLVILLVLFLIGGIALSPFLWIVVILLGLFLLFGGRYYRE